MCLDHFLFVIKSFKLPYHLNIFVLFLNFILFCHFFCLCFVSVNKNTKTYWQVILDPTRMHFFSLKGMDYGKRFFSILFIIFKQNRSMIGFILDFFKYQFFVFFFTWFLLLKTTISNLSLHFFY